MVKYICSDLPNREKRRLLYVKIQKGVQDEIKKVGNKYQKMMLRKMFMKQTDIKLHFLCKICGKAVTPQR